jgi:cyanophycinase
MSKRGSLLLVGGNDWNATPPAPGKGVVAVVPTAAAFEHWEEAVASVATRWTDAEVVPVPLLARHDADRPEIVSVLQSAAVIVLIGESSLHARAALAESPAWEAIVGSWRGGAALVGIGGGAALLGDPMVDPRGGAFTLGLNVLDKVAVLPHANTWGADRTKRTLRMALGKHALLSIADSASASWTPTGGWAATGTVSVSTGTLAELNPPRP